MNTSILGLGTAVPEHSASQVEAANFAVAHSVASDQQRRLAPRLYQRCGVDTRHSILIDSQTECEILKQSFFSPSDHAHPFGPSTAERMQVYQTGAQQLAIRAATSAIESSGITRDSITHMVSVSCSGFDAPGFDIQLIDQLPLSRIIARTHVGFMGCHGALNAMRVAKAFVDADPAARVLIVAVELCSLHYQYEWTNERIVSNSLFADGAGALIVGNGEPSEAMWELGDGLSAIVPDSLDAMTWRIGDHGFEMTLSPAVPDLIRRYLRPRIESWLARNQLTIADIEGWAVHPGGPRILQATIEALDLPPTTMAASHDILRRYGNMSSPTIVFVLDALRDATPGPTVALGFGPGLAIEARLLQTTAPER